MVCMKKIFEEEIKSLQLEDKLKKWAKKYKNKKVLVYGTGKYFDALICQYNLRKYLNVVGVSDLKYQDLSVETDKGFEVYRPSDIDKSSCEVVFVTTRYPNGCKSYLHAYELVKPNTDIITLFDKSTKDIVKEFFQKIKIALTYAKENKVFLKALKYFIFCSNNEISSKLNYERVLKRIRSYDIKAGKKVRVAFLVETNQKWGFQSVYDLLKEDNRFEIIMVALPIVTKHGSMLVNAKEDIEFFKKMGIDVIDGYNEEQAKTIDFESLDVDLIFYAHPWFCAQNNIPPSKTSKFALSCAISYGFNLVESRLWGTSTPRKFCGNLWTMFSESKWHKGFYEKGTGLKHKDNMIVTGYPKMDAYKAKVDKYFEELWKSKNQPRIIYAPHHSIENSGMAMSNFCSHSSLIFEYAKNHPEYSFIIKPHPVLKSKCESMGVMSNKEFDDYLTGWANLPNGNVYTGGNYYDLFKTSDALFTDCSSFLGEYFVSGKPIIYAESATRMPFNDFGLMLKKCFYQIKKFEDIDDIFKKIFIEKNDEKEQLRQNLIEKLFYLPEEGIGKKIVDYITRELFNGKQ